MRKFIEKTNYHTLSGVEEEIEKVAASASGIPVEMVTLGRSTQDRPIRALCFGDGDFRKPELLYFALDHSLEYIGVEAALEIAGRLASGAGDSALDNINIWVLPVLNPDGYARVEKQLSTGLGIGLARKNASGVDLNRNFPVAFYHLPRSLFAGSPIKWSPYYRGAEPCSEIESRVFRDFIIGRNFKMSLSLHCFGACILFPYFFTSRKCRDYETLMRTGEEMANRQNEPYSVKPGHGFYTSNGSIADWLYDECGILALVIEIGKLGFRPDRPETWLNPFYWFNQADPRAEVDNVVPAALYLIEAITDKFVS